MASGLLRVSGTISLAQFWPAGTSDADTTKIKVNTAAAPSSFALTRALPSPTTALANAIVHGSVSR